MPDYAVITACRSCGSSRLDGIFDFGNIPLANSLLTAEQIDRPEPKYPLNVVFCPACSLVQITATIAPEVLFRDYFYFSSVSETMLLHAQDMVEKLIRLQNLNQGSLV